MKHWNILKNNIKAGWKTIDAKLYSDKKLNLKRVLVLNKRTKYELEKALRPGIKESQLEKIIRKRGSDYDKLILHHNLHKKFLDKIVDTFNKFGLEVETVNRTKYGEKEVDWADLVVVGGGDGTFLLGASQIRNQSKPIVGFNTDPDRSEGYLCLPKMYTFDIESAVNKILKHEFSWLLRNRIEVEIEGPDVVDDVVILDSTKPTRVPDCAGPRNLRDSVIKKTILPSLALNEVFMGENMSTHVSHLLVHPDGWPLTAVKCSGLCVSTGTGSTSWHMSINRLTTDKVKKLLMACELPVDDLDSITDKYNSSLRFSPDDSRLHWNLREPIYGSVFPDPPGFPAGGFTEKVDVTSRCFSGFLVIDGTYCYSFHDGTSARLFSSPDKRLRTIYLN